MCDLTVCVQEEESITFLQSLQGHSCHLRPPYLPPCSPFAAPVPCVDPHLDLLIELFMSGKGSVAACCSFFKGPQSSRPAAAAAAAAAADGEVINTVSHQSF